MPMKDFSRLNLIHSFAALAISVLLVTFLAQPASFMPFQTAEATVAGTNGKIAFTSDRDGNFEIYVMNPDGTGQTRLTENSAGDSQPSWSPDASKIAFSSDRDGDPEIYTMNSDGTDVTKLSDNNVPDTQPAWSPDGTKIAFVSSIDSGGFGTVQIHVMNADDGQELVRLTDISDDQDDRYPTWSPDGTRIAFDRAVVGEHALFSMNADGSGINQLTEWGDITDGLSWSPDGEKIVYSYGEFRSILTIDADDGGGETGLTTPGSNPSWAPDDTEISFDSDRDGDYEIYMISDSGGDVTKLTKNAFNDLDPDWGVTSETSECTDNATISGTDGSDDIQGTPGPDIIDAKGGNDVVRGFGGNDIICGGSGNDTLRGGAGIDKIYGGKGDDLLYGSWASDKLYGQVGNDMLRGGTGNDSLYGGSGDDKVYGDAGADRMFGEPGRDLLDSRDGVVNNDSIFAGGIVGKEGGEDLDTCLSDPDPEVECEI